MGSNIPTVFSWGSSIGPEGFLPSILLLVVIIVVVVIVVVTVVLVVVVVEGYVKGFLQKLSFEAVSFSFNTYGKSSDESFMSSRFILLGVRIPPGQGIISQGVPVGPVFLLGLVVLAIVAAYVDVLLGAILSTFTRQHRIRMISQVIVKIFIHSVDLTGDEDPTYEDGDIGMGDSIGVLVSLGGGISLGGKKTQKSNIGGSGEMASEAKRYLDKLSEGLGEMFPGETGK
ncbi:hypothetical protein Tco_0906489 [Tanacetum coccineum]|uniref:Uncharacterized protein n=1 Tax=Tanacetum coccineum TaxID=301880 RepID=A0ABQ5CMT7_9ASTR